MLFRSGPDGAFTAPYVFTQWPDGTDPVDYMAVVASGVRVRGAASADAPTVGTLDFSVVELVDPPAVGARWAKVRLPTGRTGFVDVQLLRSPTDYRIRCVKRNGRWQVVSFLAGD